MNRCWDGSLLRWIDVDRETDIFAKYVEMELNQI